MAMIDGQRHTILIAKPDRISGNDSIYMSGVSQFRDPESTDAGDNKNWNAGLVELPIFRYLLSIFVFACVFVLIIGIARQMRR